MICSVRKARNAHRRASDMFLVRDEIIMDTRLLRTTDCM